MADIKILPQALASIGINQCDSNPPVMWNGSSERAAQIIAATPTQDNLFVPYGDFLYYSKRLNTTDAPVWYRLNITEKGCELFKPVFQSTVYVVEINVETPLEWRPLNWTPVPRFQLYIMDSLGATFNVGNLGVGSNRFEITDKKPTKFKIVDQAEIYTVPTSWTNLTETNGLYKGSYTLNYADRTHTFHIDVLGATTYDYTSGEIKNIQGEVLESFDFNGEIWDATVQYIGLSSWTHPFEITITNGPAAGQTYMIDDNTIASRTETWVPFNAGVGGVCSIIKLSFQYYQDPVSTMRVNFYDNDSYLYGDITDYSGEVSYTIIYTNVYPPQLRIKIEQSPGSFGSGGSKIFVLDSYFNQLPYFEDVVVENGIQYTIYHAFIALQEYGN